MVGLTKLQLHNSLFWDVAGWHLTHKADKVQLVTSMRPVVAMMVLATERDGQQCGAAILAMAVALMQSSQGEREISNGEKIHMASKCETRPGA